MSKSESLKAFWSKLRADPVRLAKREEKRIKAFKAAYLRRRQHGLLSRKGHLKKT